MTARKPLLVLFAVLAAASLQAQSTSTRLLDVRLFGHRGFTRDAPENSIAALEAAVRLGLAGSEIDLRTTRDKGIVLMHDDTVDRTTAGTGAVASMTVAGIRALKLERPDGTVTAETVPDFDAVLAFMHRHPGFSLAFDAKEIDLNDVGARVLAAGVQDRVVFFIDDPLAVDRARAVKRVDPRLRISVNLLTWWKIEGLPTFAKRALDADALFASEYFFPRAGFAEAKAAGAEIQVYVYGTDNLPDRVRRAAALGADVISSDRPDLLVPLVRPPAAR